MCEMDSVKVLQNIQSGLYKLKPRNNRKSLIWEIFAEIQKDNGLILDGWLCCQKCTKIYKCNGKQTSNLNRHKCYLKATSKEIKKKLPINDKNTTIDVLTEWVIEDCRPFSAVSGSGFRKMAEHFIKLGARHGDNIDLDHLIPEPTTISRHINGIAAAEKRKIKPFIQKMTALNKAAITMDMWTDGYLRRNFLCATLHYEENLILKEIILGVKSMDYTSSSGINIKTKLLSMLEEFGVCDLAKIKFITDRGSNMKAALHNETRLSCSNHLLSNVVQSAFSASSEFTEIETACKNLVKYFKKANLQHLLPTSLKSHCPNRWNSYLLLFRSIYENWYIINNILTERGAMHRLTQITYAALKSFINLCNGIDIISRKLQGVNYPTLCYVLPSINRLKMICEPSSDDLLLISTLKMNILNEIEIKWCVNINIWHRTATFLFPPTKDLQNLQPVLHEIKDFCMQQACSNEESAISVNESSDNNNIFSFDESQSESLSSEIQTTATNISSSSKKEEFDFFFPNIRSETLLTKTERVQFELSQYISEKIFFNEDFDVISWWGQNYQKYPILHKVALSILSIPASSAVSERAFSLAGNLITEKRNRLGAKTIDDVMFLHSVLRK